MNVIPFFRGNVWRPLQKAEEFVIGWRSGSIAKELSSGLNDSNLLGYCNSDPLI